MKAMLSFKMWLIFLHRLLKAIYPAEIVLFIFALPRLKELRKSRLMRFLMIFLLVDLGVRLVPFFACVPFSERYFFPFAVNVAIFASCGIIILVEFLDTKILKRKFKYQCFHLYAVIILIIAVSYTGKALMPRNDKPWLQVIPAAIKQLTPDGKKPAIICNDMDERFGYYAQTNEIFTLHPDQNWLLMQRERNEDDSVWTALGKKRGIAGLAENIDKIGSERVFIIMKVGKDGTSPSDTELTENLPGIKFTGKFTDRKRRVFKLYTIAKETTDK